MSSITPSQSSDNLPTEGKRFSSVNRMARISDALPLLRPYRKQLALALIIGLIGALVAAVQPQVISNIVDSFAGSVPARQIVSVVLLLLCSALLTSFRELLVERAGERFAFDTRRRLVQHIYRLPIGRFDNQDRADLVSRVTNDVSEIRSILSGGLIDLGVGLVTVAISITMMVIIDPVLVAIAVGAVVCVVIFVFAFGIRMKPVGLRVQHELGRLAGTVSRSIGSIRTIKAALAVDRESRTAVEHANSVLEAGLKAAGLRACIQTITGLSVHILLIAVVGLGALRVSAGEITTGQLSAFIMYLMLLITPVALVGSVTSQLSEALGALSRIVEVESWPQESDCSVSNIDLAKPANANAVIEFEGVSFSYQHSADENGLTNVLRHLSFRVEYGSTTALVGPSGAGKSTVLALIERFYDPQEGTIRFEGTDVQKLSRDAIRSSIAYVDQDAAVISGTVRENLQLNSDAISDDECANALLSVRLIEDVSDSASYLDKDVGELGLGLSGGERQRLAIARAILADARILLLDEITSNLDGKNENTVVQALRGMSADRTLLVVAHRLSTVIDADCILLFDDGRIVDSGSHEELLRSSALYRDLVKRQMIASN